MASAISLILRRCGGRVAIAAAAAFAVACAAGGDAVNHCGIDTQVKMSPAMATTPATLTATASFTTPPASKKWAVTLNSNDIPFTVVDQAGTQITIDAELPGTYVATIQVTDENGRECEASAQSVVIKKGSNTASYNLRITPPVSSGLPRQDLPLVIHGGTTLSGQNLTLDPGFLETGTLTGPMGPVAGTLRFLSGVGLDGLASAASDGKFSVALGGSSYQVALVPLDETLAPRTVGLNGPYVVDGGGVVSGSVRDPGGKAIVGARVELSDLLAGSGVGVTDANGQFSLHATPGKFQVVVQADGWPDLVSDPISVQDGTKLDLAYSATLYPVTGKVVGSDGVSAAASARLTIDASGGFLSIGTVAVDAGAPSVIGGALHRKVVTAGDGTLPPLSLPAGSYVILAAPAQNSVDGATGFTKQITGSDDWPLRLSPVKTFQGTILDPTTMPVGGVTVTAIEADTNLVRSVTSDGDGVYKLPGLDPGAQVELVFDPPISSRLPLARLRHSSATSNDSVTLPLGLLVSGTVLSRDGTPLSGARIDAYSVGFGGPEAAASCATDGDGAFTLSLPDPG
jgi:hypothetical protein